MTAEEIKKRCMVSDQADRMRDQVFFNNMEG